MRPMIAFFSHLTCKYALPFPDDSEATVAQVGHLQISLCQLSWFRMLYSPCHTGGSALTYSHTIKPFAIPSTHLQYIGLLQHSDHSSAGAVNTSTVGA